MANLAQRDSLAKADLWLAYRSAFDDFAQAARKVQDLIANPGLGGPAVDAALLALEKARRVYGKRRDALAHHLSHGSLPDSPQELPGCVRPVAELLWEVAGRRDGAAEEDWFRAEQIVRCAGRNSSNAVPQALCR